MQYQRRSGIRVSAALQCLGKKKKRKKGGNFKTISGKIFPVRPAQFSLSLNRSAPNEVLSF